MFKNPVFSSIPKKMEEYLLLSLLILMYIAACAEVDIFVPALPQVIQDFQIGENQVQWILSINLLSLCVTSLFVGPLSDAWGRRKVLLVSLAAFLAGSLGCCLSHDFSWILFWRVVQGAGTAAPMVVGQALLCDVYSMEKAGALIGGLNVVITGGMAGAPILGAWLTANLGWRANFVIISCIVLVALMILVLFQQETLPEKDRKKFKPLQIVADYRQLLGSFNFMGNTLIAMLPFTCILMYISNISIIFVNHLGISLQDLGFYQATTMGTFIIFSALSTRVIQKQGMNAAKKWGTLLAALGAVSLTACAVLAPDSVPLICLAMAFIAAGGAWMVGPFGVGAISVFPELKGTSAALMNGLRQLMAATLVAVSECFFNGSIVPVATLIFTCSLIGAALYRGLSAGSHLQPNH